MTLANFNSNFNWQLRALQQAAECCGIVPDLPPASQNCYFYTFFSDPNCAYFNSISTDWVLNGFTFLMGWPNLMVTPPYGSTGNGVSYIDFSSGCGSFNASSYYMWTMVPTTTLTLPPLVGNDSNGNPVSYPMLGPICGTKCYEGSLISFTGTTYVYSIVTAEVNASAYSIFVDLSSPTASDDFVNQLSIFYPAASITVNIVVNAPNDYTIRINNLYSLSMQVDLFMDDGVSAGSLFEVPC